MIHFEWSKLSFYGSDDRVPGIVTSAKGGPGLVLEVPPPQVIGNYGLFLVALPTVL